VRIVMKTSLVHDCNTSNNHFPPTAHDLRMSKFMVYGLIHKG
jgi:hypothetical protein